MMNSSTRSVRQLNTNSMLFAVETTQPSTTSTSGKTINDPQDSDVRSMISSAQPISDRLSKFRQEMSNYADNYLPIDQKGFQDPQNVAEYAEEICQDMIKIEKNFVAKPGYMVI